MLLWIVAACEPDDERDPGPPEPPPGSYQGCTVQGCGSNSSDLAGTNDPHFMDALNLDGLANASGVRLVPDSFRCGTPLQWRRLELEAGGAIVGLDDDGNVACRDADLVDAQLQVRWAPGELATVRIRSVGVVATWHQLPSSRELIPTYEIEWRRDGATGPFASLCSRRAAPWQTGATTEAAGKGTQWHTETTDAVILQGDIYDATGTVVRHDPRWFHIACAGAALSKMRLLGYDAMARPEDHGGRQATLKMLTARYDGAASLTKPGVALKWVSLRDVHYDGGPPEDRVGPTEAQWGPGGAVCLDHLRTWQKGAAAPPGTEARAVGSIRNGGGFPLRPCDAQRSARDRTIEWITSTVDHVEH